MYKAKVNSEKGITLTALVIYIIIMVMVIGIMTTISSAFFKNVYSVVDTPEYLSEINKFIMFFGADVKDYNSATVTSDAIQFENGPTYKFQNNCIYRNDVIVSKDVLKCTFTGNQIEVSGVTKNIINVYMQIGKDEEKSIEKNIDFTLKYW